MFPYICVLDFEATCDKSKTFYPRNEVIEFPSVLLQLIDGKYTIVDEFQEFCKPLHNIKLTDFCKELTGIQQQQVSNGYDFPDVLRRHQLWLEKHCSLDQVIIVCCGRWDICEMMINECNRWTIKPHDVYKKMINVKDLFCARYGDFRGGMALMLDYMGFELVGRHHSGLDDSRNIARMVIELQDEINEDMIIMVDNNKYNLTKAERAKNLHIISKNRQK